MESHVLGQKLPIDIRLPLVQNHDITPGRYDPGVPRDVLVYRRPYVVDHLLEPRSTEYVCVRVVFYHFVHKGVHVFQAKIFRAGGDDYVVGRHDHVPVDGAQGGIEVQQYDVCLDHPGRLHDNLARKIQKS